MEIQNKSSKASTSVICDRDAAHLFKAQLSLQVFRSCSPCAVGVPFPNSVYSYQLSKVQTRIGGSKFFPKFPVFRGTDKCEMGVRAAGYR